MENKQTAVECFYEGLFKHVKASSLYSSNDVTNPEWVISKHRIIELLEFCKQMEKEQIMNSYYNGMKNQQLRMIDKWHIDKNEEDYYNETYGK